jgi:hypothetical protein
MKSTAFWVRRFLMVFGGASLFLLAVYVLRGMDVDRAIREAVLWGFMAASIFTGARYYNASRGKACAMCRDTVED